MANGLRVFVLALAALLAACSGPESVQSARKDVDRFHRQLDAQQLDAIWNGSSQDLRISASREAFDGLLTRIHENLGNAVSTKQVGWATNINGNGSFVTLNMQTQFERGSGREEFVFRNTDGKFALAGYHIQPGNAPAAPASASATAEADDKTT